MAGNSIAAAGDPDFKTLFGYSLVHIRFDINMLSILALAGRLLKLMIALHVKRERLAVDVSIAPTITNIHYFYALSKVASAATAKCTLFQHHK